ncbi:MAG: hypothetical protein NTX76_03595 [Alphaproteobacteria bacterium]|nr:hypothetical protein [Alphaproteobacteria bacterium]
MRQKWKYCVDIMCVASFLLSIEDGCAIQDGVEDSESSQVRAADFVVLRAQEKCLKKVCVAIDSALGSMVMHEFPVLKDESDKRHEKIRPMLERFLPEEMDHDDITDKKSDNSATGPIVSFFSSIFDKLGKFVLSGAQ